MLDSFAILILYMTFGGAFELYNFTDIVSKLDTDLGNDILPYEVWDKQELFLPNINNIPSLKLLNESIFFWYSSSSRC